MGRAALVIVPEPVEVNSCLESLRRIFGQHNCAHDNHQALFERVRSYRNLGRLSKHMGVPIAIHFPSEAEPITLEDGRRFVAGDDGSWRGVS